MRDAILVKRGFHMCSHCIFISLYLSFGLKERQIHIGQVVLNLGELPLGEFIIGRNDLIPPCLLHYALYDTLLNYHSSIPKMLIVHDCGQLSFDVCSVSTEAL